MSRARISISAVLILLACGLAHAETAASSDAALLTISGVGADALKLSRGDLAKLPRQTVHVKEKGGDVEFQGVALRDLLKQAGVKFSDKPSRGELLLTYVIVEAADGYKVLFALSEFEADITDKLVLIADTADGHALEAKDGPLRVIVPDEKMHARWSKQVVAVKVVRSPETQKPSENREKH